MHVPNTQWMHIISQASVNMEQLLNPLTLEQLINILRTNQRACTTIGHDFIVQLGMIYMDMLHVYKCISEQVSAAINMSGPMALEQSMVKGMKLVKKEVLKLISTWVARSNDPQTVIVNFIPPLLDAVLLDYQQAPPDARDAEVLATMATIVNRLQQFLSVEIVLNIFSAVFEPTIQMITMVMCTATRREHAGAGRQSPIFLRLFFNPFFLSVSPTQDFEQYPDHRVTFYQLLLAITTHCFPAYCALTPAQFETVVDAIVWAFKHPIRHVAETGLKIMKQLLDKVVQAPDFAQNFFAKFFLSILQHMFAVVTDSTHFSGLID